MIGCNYWAIPNMGKMHLMQLCETNKKIYTKIGGKYYFYKQWHDSSNYKKRIEKIFFVRKGRSNIETSIRTKTTYGEKPDVAHTQLHKYLHDSRNSTFEEKYDHLVTKHFGDMNDREPPADFMKGKDPVEVFFTDKWFAELSKLFPIAPSGNYLGTFLEPYLLSNTKCIIPLVDELCDVDVLFNPFSLMGKHDPKKDGKELEEYVLKLYKSRKNIVPYKEDLIDCFASKLKRAKKRNVLVTYREDKNIIWRHLDGIVRNLRRIEKYLQHNGIEPIYFNMDRDDYKEVFGFDNDKISRDSTHPGDYPEKNDYENIAKEYVIIRDMKDMRRRNRLRDRIQ